MLTAAASTQDFDYELACPRELEDLYYIDAVSVMGLPQSFANHGCPPRRTHSWFDLPAKAQLTQESATTVLACFGACRSARGRYRHLWVAKGDQPPHSTVSPLRVARNNR